MFLPVKSTEVEISDYNQIIPQADFLKGSLQIFEGFGFTVGRSVKDSKSNFTIVGNKMSIKMNSDSL